MTSKCERKVVRKFALETEKLMHSLCPTNESQQKPCHGLLIDSHKLEIALPGPLHSSSPAPHLSGTVGNGGSWWERRGGDDGLNTTTN